MFAGTMLDSWRAVFKLFKLNERNEPLITSIWLYACVRRVSHQCSPKYTHKTIAAFGACVIGAQVLIGDCRNKQH